jgi:short-subunit dehydrogenase
MTGDKPLAIVTGASSGFGLELAKEFGRNGFDLLINAEDARLEGAAEQVASSDVAVQTVRADLRSYDGVEQLYAAIRATNRPVEVAALNAGVGQGGAFLDIDLADELEIIALNVTSTVHLAKRLVPDMVARSSGRVLVTSSIASTMPGTFQAVYNASKSFVQSFTEALQNELKDTGVTLTAVMPGPMDTDFFHRADMDDTRVGASSKDDPAQAAEQAVAALLKGEAKVVVGSLKTKAQGVANKVLPDSVKAAGHRRMAEPGSGD